MHKYTPTTWEVRAVWAEFDRLCPRGGRARTAQTTSAEFDRWLSEVKAAAWEEGFVAGVNVDMGDYEHPPEIVTNPYHTYE